MTWFKENKFLGGLLVITGLLAAFIIYMGLKFSTTLEEKQEEIATAEGQDRDMRNLNPFPTIENAEAKSASLKALLKKAEAVQKRVLAFRPENVENIAITSFEAGLTKSVEEVKALFPGEKALPERFHLGFEDYASGPANEKATGVLNYQREAFDWMFRELAAAGVQEIVNLHRVKLPAESGVDWNDEAAMRRFLPKPKKKKIKPKKGAPKKRPAPQPENLPAVAHRMPFELTFRAPENAVRKFLQSLANSDKYFIEARISRVKNEAPIPEKKKKKVAKADDSADFGPIDGEESEDDGPATQILDRVSGGEDLTVFLRAEVLLFKNDQQFPVVK